MRYAITTAVIVLLVLTFASLYARQDGPTQPESTAKTPLTPLTADFAVPVLMYHRICDLTPEEARSPLMRDLTVSPAQFEEQVRYLVDNRFTVLTVEEVEAALRERHPLPERAVALTMDDGYRDNFTCAFPILARYGIPATVFLVTGVVGDGRHVSWDDARAMQAKTCTFESHTVHHYDLTALKPELLDSELRASKASIESRLSTPVSQIAYPSGAYNAMVTERARQAGYAIGWKKGGGPVTPGGDPYLLPRIRVRGSEDMATFRQSVWSGVELRRLRSVSRQ